MKLDDLTGRKFNHLTAIERIDGIQPTTWRCMCDCGTETIVRANNLKSGAVKSCGCLLHEKHNTHHQSKTKLYHKWNSMKRRCYDQQDYRYKDYGGRGIEVCDEWKNSFETFRDWCISSGYSEKTNERTLDRIDNNGNYEPSNCKWSTPKEQSNNRRSNVMIEYDGRTQNLTQWCEEFGIEYKRVHDRMFKKHWDFEDAISKPVDVSKINIKYR